MKKVFTLSLLVYTASAFAQNGIGLNLSSIDSTVSPRNDFYRYANGKWLSSHEIPASESSWGSFKEIDERNTAKIRTLLEEVSKDKAAAAGTNAQKLRDFYNLAMDTMKLEKDGKKPISADLSAIDKIKNIEGLLKTSAVLNKEGIPGMIGFYVYSDFKNSTVNTSYLGQTGLGLPDKDYYFDAEYESIRKAYQAHVERMFVLLGYKPDAAKAAATVVMNVETSLASKSMNAVEQRDIQAQYNPYTKEELIKFTPNINWELYFKSLGLAMPSTIVLNQVKYYEELNTLITTISIQDWKTFLKWKLVHEAATFLSSKFVEENFAFYGKELSGAKQMRPRWKRVQGTTDGALGEVLGQLYVDKYFNADAKARVNKMVDNLIAAYRERINSRDWMSAETKQQAQTKLDKLIRKLGYPDKWLDYSKLTVATKSYWDNQMRSNEFQFQRMVDKMGNPVDRYEWGMTPPTVNAYYNPSTNEITFPAGIMQPPFFDPAADDAFNYGMMGAVIGHELTHGFDDQGSQFDADGNLKMWWTEEDYKKFQGKTQLIINQFNAYVAVDTVHVKGELTQGENIADLGGLTMAYYAYEKSLNGKPSPVIAGYTGEQRFFLSWAQGWKTLMRPAAMKQLVATNPHAPGNFRAMAPLCNMQEFYDAFGVKEGDAMYRPADKRVMIW